MTGKDFKPRNFLWRMEGQVAVITLDRPEKKNPLTFESYAELRDSLEAISEHTNVIGFDFVEVNPQLDVGTGLTSYLGATR